MGAECVDGLWRFTGYDVWQVPDRPVFLPVWKFWSATTKRRTWIEAQVDRMEWAEEDLCAYEVITDQPRVNYNRFGNYYRGRIVVADHSGWSDDGPAYIPDSYFTNSGPTDILRWHLYWGGPHQDRRGAGTSAKLPQYEEHLAKLRELAPDVGGILVGNCGAELAFHHLLTVPDQKQREWCIQKDVDFIRETGDLIAGAGGRPVYMPMDREVLIDCYHGEWRMAQAVAEYGGLMIVCAEWAIFPRWHCIYGNSDTDGIWYDGEDEPHPDRQGWRDDFGAFVDWEKREAYPYPTLLEYYAAHEIWHCLGYDLDWRRGADKILQAHGVRGLVY